MKRIHYLLLGLLVSLTIAAVSPGLPLTRITPGAGIAVVTNGVNDFTISAGGTATNLTVNGTFTVNTNRLYVNTTAVGIGTASPGATLTVAGTMSVDRGAMTLFDSTAALGGYVQTASGKPFSVYAGGAQTASFLSNSNLLVGTATDSGNRLNVLGTVLAGSPGTGAYYQLLNSTSGDACYWQIISSGGGGMFELYTAGTQRIKGSVGVQLSTTSGSVQVNNGTTDTLRDLSARSLYATNLYTTNLIVGGGATVTKILTGTATLDFDLTAVVVQDATLTVTGAALGDVVVLGAPAGSFTTTVQYMAWVGSADTVSVRARTAAVGENPASGTFRATIIKH